MQATRPSENLIQNPLALIHSIFRAHPNSPSDINGSCRLAKSFMEILQQDTSIIDKIPSLNSTPLERVATGSLVRFRCMVQDMFDPEYFLDVYEETDTRNGTKRFSTGRYQDLLPEEDHIVINEDQTSQRFAHRHPVYAVPVPGESDWARLRDQHTPPASAPTAVSKRQHEPMEEDGSESSPVSVVVPENSTIDKKLKIVEPPMAHAPNPSKSSSRVPSATNSFALNFPLPNTPGSPCIIKMYTEELPFKLNDIIEVLGVLAISPELVSFDEIDPAFQEPTHSIPSSIAPRVHVLHFSKVTHGHPLLTRRENNTVTLAHVAPEPFSNLLVLRETVVSTLAAALYGDRLAAEYLLLALLSRVHSREGIYTLGKLSLNLSCADSLTRLNLERVISLLMPRCASIMLTRATLNQGAFLPKKDYEANRLQTGLLQLPEGTVVVFDETVMDEGKLDEKGVEHFNCLSKLIDSQRVTYTFHEYQNEFDADFRILVLSQGTSLLPCDVVVPFKREPLPVHEPTLSPEVIDAMRAYLAIVPYQDYQIPRETAEVAENEFVRMRQTNPEFSIDLFHHWLTIARLLALSYGERSLSFSRWEQMRSLELARLLRIPPKPAAKQS